MKINQLNKIAFVLSLFLLAGISVEAQTQWTENFEKGWGIWNDGGADAMRLLKATSTPQDIYHARLRDDNDQASSIFTDILDLTLSSQATISFTYEAHSMETGEDFFLEYSDDGGNSFEIIKNYVSGEHFQNREIINETVTINKNFTNNTVLRFRCDASSNYDQIYLDDISISAGGSTTYDCPTLTANIGDICNDGNPATSNDMITSDCTCSGTVAAPAECTGKITCLEINPLNNSELIGQVNGKEFCSDRFTGSVLSINATVSGTHQSMKFIIESPLGVVTSLENKENYSSDNFGATTIGTYKIYAKLYSRDNQAGTLCDQSHVYFTIKDCASDYDCPLLNANIGDNCNDFNPTTNNDVVTAYCTCEGTPNIHNCNHNLIHYQGFESDMGLWRDGGPDCTRVLEPNSFAMGNYCIRLRDNSGEASSLIYDNLNLAGAAECKVNFIYFAEGMETGEDFILEYSTDGGTTFNTIKKWVAGTDFNNGNRISQSISFSGNFSAQTQLRFRCDASTNFDLIFLDEIHVYACTGSGTLYDCPALSAHMGDNCNDGNPNTINDSINTDCTCEGIPASTGCTEQLINEEGFESGMGIWNDGGADALRFNDPDSYIDGAYTIRLRDNSGEASGIISDPLNFNGVSECRVDFKYLALSMEPGEKFLIEYSTNDQSYDLIHQWVAGVDFQNGDVMTESISFSGDFSTYTKIRIRCEASSNYDYIYLDEIQIHTCSNAGIIAEGNGDTPAVTYDSTQNAVVTLNLDQILNSELETTLSVYPNPVTGHTLHMNIKTQEDTSGSGSIYSQYGEFIQDFEFSPLYEGSNLRQVDISDMGAGAYLLKIEIGPEVLYEKIVILR